MEEDAMMALGWQELEQIVAAVRMMQNSRRQIFESVL